MKFLRLQRLRTTKIPIRDKKILQVINAGTINAQMSVTPKQFTFFVINIFVTYINATHKSRLSIYHNDLPVIPIIDTVGKQIKMYFMKRIYLYTGGSHSSFNFLLDRRAAEIIVDKPNCHSFLCLLYQ